jgi:toluene monooxygenase system ferredoxin subunit
VSFQYAARAEDLWEGEMLGVRVAGVPVLLLHLDGRLYAYEDRCAHQAVPLSQGRLEGGVLTCSAHEWQYDPTTGCGRNPSGVRVKAFAVRRAGDEIQVDVDG